MTNSGSGADFRTSRLSALLVSAAIHIVAATGVVLFWPASRMMPGDASRSVSGAPTPTATRRLPAASEPARRADADPSSEPGRTAGSASAVARAAGDGRVPHVRTTDAPGAVHASQPIALLTREGETVQSAVLNHLWQSTLFALAIGVLTLVFRRNHARVRYWLWFAASIKFLIPFSLLIALGGTLPLGALPLGAALPAAAPSGAALAITQIGQPFSFGAPQAASAVTSSPAAGVDWIRAGAVILWVLGFELVAWMRLRTWREIRLAVKASSPAAIAGIALPAGARVRSTRSLLEPGVIGFWRPVLLLPAGIEAQLAPAEFDAVVAHEACHMRSRDNLTAAVHMLVEAVFWFHPLVWWIGARMIQERERACDQDVLSALDNPRAYADGIVSVCKRYVDARLACVPGVGSSDLRRRIERIMKHETGDPLARWKRVALGGLAAAVVTAPIAIGAVDAPPRAAAQTPASASASAPSRGAAPAGALAFQAASVKPNRSGNLGVRFDTQATGRLTATNAPVALLIRFAYDLQPFQVSGGPDWLNSERFDVVASADGDPSLEQKRLMLRTLLADRFKLTTHTETRDLPIYALTLARSDGRLGRGLRRSNADCTSNGSPMFPGALPGAAPDGGPPQCGFFGMAPGTNLPSARGGWAFRGLTMGGLSASLMGAVHRSVKDQTGLSGYFDGDFDFIAELPPPPPPPGLPNPFTTPFVSVFTALPEQLGLKLDSKRGPVDVLVIDGAQHPTEN